MNCTAEYHEDERWKAFRRPNLILASIPESKAREDKVEDDVCALINLVKDLSVQG